MVRRGRTAGEDELRHRHLACRVHIMTLQSQEGILNLSSGEYACTGQVPYNWLITTSMHDGMVTPINSDSIEAGSRYGFRYTYLSDDS